MSTAIDTPAFPGLRKWCGWVVLLFALTSLTVDPLPAATHRVWTGAFSPFWSNPANWSNGVPVAGDSLEFPDNAIRRDVVNDLPFDYSIGSIVIKGRNFKLGGNRISLQGDLISQPSNSSNRIDLDLTVNSPLTIDNQGYFNVLELGGYIRLLHHPLVVRTSSDIILSGSILDTNHMGVIQRDSGTLSFGIYGGINGTMIVERGLLLITNVSNHQHLTGNLIVGNDTDPPGWAKARWDSKQRVRNLDVEVNRSGIVELNGPYERRGMVEKFRSLAGEGTVFVNMGELQIDGRELRSRFEGTLNGTGSLRLIGLDAGFELAARGDFAGEIQVVPAIHSNDVSHVVSVTPSRLDYDGDLTNATIVLAEQTMLSGNGRARSLSSTNGTVRPGPGALRFLDEFRLDAASRVAFQIDGPDAGFINAATTVPGGAALELMYDGDEASSVYTLISANVSPGGSTFNGLPEGKWLIIGDPAHDFRITYVGGGGHDVVLERTGYFVPPTLSIHISGDHRIIEWPLSAQGYTLQYTTLIDAPVWNDEGLSQPDATASEFFVVERSDEMKRFYRLVR